MKIQNITNELLKYLSLHGVTAISYFDRVKINLDANVREEYLTELLASNKNNKLIMKEFTPNSHLDRELDLFQPSNEDFEQLKAISGGCAISYVECAIDFMTEDNKILENIAYLFNRNFVHYSIKYKALEFYYHNYKYLDETIYFNPKLDELRLVMYTDKPARNKPDLKCLHLEYRITGLGLVKDNGIITINNLITFNHEQLWDKLLDFRKCNLTELGRLLYKTQSANIIPPTRKTFNKRGKKLYDNTYSLQEYLQDNPEHESAFKEIATIEVLKKLVAEAFQII